MTANIRNFFKSCFVSRTFIVLVSILIGSGATLLAQNIASSKASDSDNRFLQSNKSEFNQNLFPDHSAIFAEMEAMEKRMNEVFKANHEYMKAAFDKASKNNTNINQATISSKQDDNFYYYELNFSGFNKQDIMVGVKDNILTFSAQNKKESVDKKQEISASSNFHYSFMVPEYDQKKEPEIIREDNKIIVKLNKKISQDKGKSSGKK